MIALNLYFPLLLIIVGSTNDETVLQLPVCYFETIRSLIK